MKMRADIWILLDRPGAMEMPVPDIKNALGFVLCEFGKPKNRLLRVVFRLSN